MLANVLTMLRVVIAAGFAVCLAAATGWGGGRAVAPGALSGGWMLVLLALAGAAELTDMFDGIAARWAKTAGPVGGLLDPLCDSLSRLTMYFAVALAGWAPLAVPLVMVGRDLVVAYARIFQAYMNWPTSARVSGKLKAIIQGGGLFVLVVLAGLDRPWTQTARLATAAVVVIVTLWSLADYLRAGIPAAVAMYRKNR